MSKLIFSIMTLLFIGSTQFAQAEPIKQISLKESQIKNFIAAQPDLNALKPEEDPRLNDAFTSYKNLDAIAVAHGFQNFNELNIVADNISLVLSGLDSSLNFEDPKKSLQKEIASWKADKSISEENKAQVIQELQEALATAPDLEHRENIEMVKRFYKEIMQSL